MKKYLWLLALIVLGFFFLTFKLMSVPPGVNGDEASIGYSAYLVGTTGFDENGRFFPLFIQTMGGKDWKQPVTFYTLLLLFKSLGYEYTVFKLVSVFFALVSLAILYLILEKILGISSAIMGCLIFIASPIILIHSHLTLENIAPVPFVLAALFFYVRYKDKEKLMRKQLVFCGMLLGASLYSYNGMRLITPMLYLIFLFFIYWEKKSLKDVFAFTLGAVPFILAIPFIRNIYPGALLGGNYPQLPSLNKEILYSYLSNYDLSFLYFRGDVTPYHSTGKSGVFLLSSLPLFLIGAYKSLQSKNSIFKLCLVSFFLGPVLYLLVGDIYRASRLLSIVPFYIVIAALGIKQVLQLGKKTILGAGLLALMLAEFIGFVHDYWYYYPDRVKQEFASPLHIAFAEMREQVETNGKVPLIEEAIFQKEKHSVIFLEKLYFPGGLRKWEYKEELPGNPIILATTETVEKYYSGRLVAVGPRIEYYSVYGEK